MVQWENIFVFRSFEDPRQHMNRYDLRSYHFFIRIVLIRSLLGSYTVTEVLKYLLVPIGQGCNIIIPGTYVHPCYCNYWSCIRYRIFNKISDTIVSADTVLLSKTKTLTGQKNFFLALNGEGNKSKSENKKSKSVSLCGI